MPTSRIVLVRFECEGWRRLKRALERCEDSFAVFADRYVRELGREWDPDYESFLLSEEDLDSLEARRMGRTLEEIDELKEVK